MKSIQDALIAVGLATEKQRPKKRQFKPNKVGKCRRCGQPLITIENANVAVCQNPTCPTNKPQYDKHGNPVSDATSFIVFSK